MHAIPQSCREEHQWELDQPMAVFSSTRYNRERIDSAVRDMTILSYPELVSAAHWTYDIVEQLNRVSLGDVDVSTGQLLTSISNEIVASLAHLANQKSAEETEAVLLRAIHNRRTARQMSAPHSHATCQEFWGIISVMVAGMPDFMAAIITVHQVVGLAQGALCVRSRRCDEASDFSKQLSMLIKEKSSPPSIVAEWCCLGNLRDSAFRLCGEQEQARDGTFTIFLFMDLRRLLGLPSCDIGDDFGAVEKVNYLHLHWICGMVGHGVYLASELLGFRSNAMGYYDEDGVHCFFLPASKGSGSILRTSSESVLLENAWQCLYTIAVGVTDRDVEERFKTGKRKTPRNS
jgi:hypothetical protein